MIKIYKANTNVSINVVLPSKKNLHIAFVPLSNGCSTYATDKEDIQTAIEQHYRFGTLFRLHSVVESKGLREESKELRVESGELREKSGESLRKVKVSDYASAKDYLADTFGISRTALRSQKSILEQAAARGIEFDGLE